MENLTNNTIPLLLPYEIGDLKLKNRMVMAPMTRSRSFNSGIPHHLASLYYSQRANAGLIITEGVQVSPEGIGYLWTPGNYTKEQQIEWRKIVESVHQKDGIIFQQLWHTGRIAHSSLRPNKQLPKAPSPIRANGKIYTNNGWAEFETPLEMSKEDIKNTIQQFKEAAKNAKQVGFDGVDIHGAFGYLIDQFICDGTNQRQDEYGISAKNRIRFALEVIEAILEVWDSLRVGIKLSPVNLVNDMSDSNPKDTYSVLLEELNKYNLAYVMLMEPQKDVHHLKNYPIEVLKYFRPYYKGNLIANANMNKEKGNDLIQSGLAQLVSFGELFISNPDLPKRFELDATLNPANRKTFYGGTEVGYTDYPFLD
ncbi:MAG TPA: alkene reductase [Candidatus Kapabacteria bacterium]|nr:alkene reductase [Candidatus Kapabacteria bacterium]